MHIMFCIVLILLIFIEIFVIKLVIYVLLKALPPFCMKYTARDESRVANIT